MKRLLALCLTVLIAGCGTPVSSSQQPVAAEPLQIAALKGPTAMGLAALPQEDYTVAVMASADEMTALLLKGELFAAAIPVNLAVVLNQKSAGKLKIAAVNTLGVLYIVETGESIRSVADLKGKTLYATGQNTVPEYTLRHILTQNGLDPDTDLTLEFKATPDEVATLLATRQAEVAMLPEPFVTVAKAKTEGLRTALSLSEEYARLHTAPYVTGVLVVSEQLAADSARMEKLLADYHQSVEVITGQNVDHAAELVAALDILPAPMAKQAIANCAIRLVTGQEMQTLVSDYLDILYDANPQSVGGARPDETLFAN